MGCEPIGEPEHIRAQSQGVDHGELLRLTTGDPGEAGDERTPQREQARRDVRGGGSRSVVEPVEARWLLDHEGDDRNGALTRLGTPLEDQVPVHPGQDVSVEDPGEPALAGQPRPERDRGPGLVTVVEFGENHRSP